MLLQQSVLLFLWLPGAFSGPSECISELYDIQTAEAATSPQEAQDSVRTYTLCPNTTYKIAESFGENGEPRNGRQAPLILGRPNVQIVCGEDGSSDNQCVLTGGHFQVHLSEYFLDLDGDDKRKQNQEHHPISNTLLQGITFESSNTFNILAEYPGDLLVQDCIFRDNKSISLVFAHLLDKSLSDQSLRSLSLSTSTAPSYDVRQRITKEDEETSNAPTNALKVIIRDCIFVKNTIWAYSGISIDGLLSVQDGASLEVYNSVFTNNFVESQIHLGFFVGVSDGHLLLRNNCFFNNDDSIAPVVLEGTKFFAESNFVQRTSDTRVPNTGCEFASVVSAGSISTNTLAEITYSCVPADESICTVSPAMFRHLDVHCLDNIESIADAEAFVMHDSWTRTYILCPNTTYTIQDAAIPLARSNLHILCGLTGTSSNNCVLQGGEVQLLIQNVFYSSDIARNVLVRGLSLVGATYINFLVDSGFPSDVVLEDCVFRGNRNLATIYIGLDHDSTTIGLVSFPHTPGTTFRGEKRGEKIGNTHLMVNNCQFIGNAVGTLPGQDGGLITSHNASLHIFDSTFNGTTNEGDLNQKGYVVGSFDSSLEMVRNCFVENEVTDGAVIAVSGIHITGQNYGQNPGTHTCDFMAVFQNLEDDEFSCIEFDSSSCHGEAAAETWQQVDNEDLRPNQPIDEQSRAHPAEKASFFVPVMAFAVLQVLGWS